MAGWPLTSYVVPAEAGNQLPEFSLDTRSCGYDYDVGMTLLL